LEAKAETYEREEEFGVVGVAFLPDKEKEGRLLFVDERELFFPPEEPAPEEGGTIFPLFVP
jgi:hypothetical protein